MQGFEGIMYEGLGLTDDCHGDAGSEGDLAAENWQGDEDAADGGEDSCINWHPGSARHPLQSA